MIIEASANIKSTASPIRMGANRYYIYSTLSFFVVPGYDPGPMLPCGACRVCKRDYGLRIEPAMTALNSTRTAQATHAGLRLVRSLVW